MIDARYEHARQSDQSGGRGWCFHPAPKSRKDTPLWVVLFCLIGGPAVMFFAGVMLT